MQTPHTVLVVDDADDSRELAAVVLESAGFAVIGSATGTDALRLARGGGVRAVVLDVNLPDGDGFSVCQQLKAEPATADIPVLFLSTPYTGLDARIRGMKSGADGYLTKPYEPAELVSAVTSLLRLREAEAALRTRDCLLTVARVVGGVMDVTEALRLVCRELTRLTGADTVGAYRLDRERRELRPAAGYHLPEHARRRLTESAVPEQPFWSALAKTGQVVWSDDVPGDARFAFDLVRALPHQSAVGVPLLVDGELAGLFYLLWWTERRRLTVAEAATLEAIGQQIGVLLRNAWLMEEAELRRRVAEAAKEHYRLLFERNLAGVFRAMRDGRLIECNDAFARLVGHGTREQALPHNAWDVYADAGERDRLLDRLDREQRVTNHEVRWRRADGAALTVMMSATRIGDGRHAQIEGIVLDVTERVRAEDGLRAREAQLRNLGNNLPDGVIYQVVRRPDGSNYFPYMSSGMEHTFGATAEEAMRDASVAYRLVLPEDLERIRAAADESIRTGEPFDVEYRMRTPDGGVRWMSLRARPSRLPDGATQWDAVAVDVTDRKRAQDMLERYRLLFERSFVGIFRTRAEGVVVDCNDAFARILGYGGAAEVRGHSVVGHYPTPAERDAIVARLAAGEDVVDAELTARRLDGSLVPVAMSVRRIVEPDGPIHEGVLLDLTDRKHAEEATALRSVAELANAAAHEINNPLTIILGQLSVLEQRRHAGAIEATREAALRIRDIVTHMTRITRLERSEGWSPTIPQMLDIRRSGGDEGRPGGDTRRPD